MQNIIKNHHADFLQHYSIIVCLCSYCIAKMIAKLLIVITSVHVLPFDKSNHRHSVLTESAVHTDLYSKYNKSVWQKHITDFLHLKFDNISY